MDFILNEKSLYGQFEDVETFLKSLKNNIRCFDIIHRSGKSRIFKTTNFYECAITEDMKIRDLKNQVNSDELLRFQIQLTEEIYTKPYWDENVQHDMDEEYMWQNENVTATALAEAVAHKSSLLSFDSDQYRDQVLCIQKGDRDYKVLSIYSPGYLAQNHSKDLSIGRCEELKILYEGTRIDCSLLESKSGQDFLEQHEYELLKKTLYKFVRHESWESIDLDDGLEYKKYHGSGKSDWFTGYPQTIMKFRYSGKQRVFGYRKGDRFRVLYIERDHKTSDKG